MDIPRPIPGWVPSTPEVRASTIDDVTRQHRAVAIHFWAVWNANARRMDKNIQAIQRTFEGRVYFVSCNVDLHENGELCRFFRVSSIPTLGFFISGMQRRSVLGLLEPKALTDEIESQLRASAPRPWWAFWRR